MAIGEREVWACAQLLLKQHGAEARAHAYRRADELLAAGDHAGCTTFRRIAQRIDDLEATTAPDPPN